MDWCGALERHLLNLWHMLDGTEVRVKNALETNTI